MDNPGYKHEYGAQPNSIVINGNLQLNNYTVNNDVICKYPIPVILNIKIFKLEILTDHYFQK